MLKEKWWKFVYLVGFWRILDNPACCIFSEENKAKKFYKTLQYPGFIEKCEIDNEESFAFIYRERPQFTK